jgi:DNA-directed RNA polymerase subunit F
LETFGLNPETLSNEQQVEFFDTVFGEAITGVNDVLKKTFEGPQGQAFKEKIRASLDRKAKEFSEQYKMNQQSLIRKSTDRENELTTEIQHLKEKTRLMDKLIERTESSITTLETSLKTSLQNISEINARHENDRNRSEIQIKELSKKLKEVFEYIESSNKFNDEEIEKLKDELKKSSSNVTAKILALS